MDRIQAYNLISNYITGWVENNPEKILESLTDDCVIVESHGPVYRGRQHVSGWLEGWIQGESKVTKWDMLSFLYADGLAAFQWDFACRTRDVAYHFKGMSHVGFQDGKIAEIREYCMTNQPYEAPAIYS